MAEQQFKAGDLVELRSGGPRMTVTDPNASYDDGGMPARGVECVWHSKANDEFKRHFFAAAALKVAKSDEQATREDEAERAALAQAAAEANREFAERRGH